MRVRRTALLLTLIVAAVVLGGGTASAARRVHLIEKKSLVVSDVATTSATVEALINTTTSEPTSYRLLFWVKCPPRVECTVPVHELLTGTVPAGSERVSIKEEISNIPERFGVDRYGYVVEMKASNGAGTTARDLVTFKLQ